MYYNNNDKILIEKLPKNLLRSDGSLFINFNQEDVDILSDYGFYSVRNDNKEPPTNNSIEIHSKKQIILDKPYVDIVRIWIDTVVPTNIVEPPQNKE
jgi:hypothetical protein